MTEELSVWAEVDLGKITRNVRRLRAFLEPETLLLTVVKADGYGHGAAEVSAAAIEGGVSWLAVARVQEAEPIRDAGISVPILVLAEPANDSITKIPALDLTLTIYTIDGARALSEVGQRSGKRLPVHVKVDTGMHRYGVQPERLPELLAEVDRLRGVELTGIWSHFSVADEPANPYTKQQYEKFIEVLDFLEGRRHTVIKHLSNSAGLLGFPEAQFDMVRAGIAVYGIAPSEEVKDAVVLEPAMHMKSRVGLVKRLGAGETISYGQTYTTESETTIATVPCGYADGLRRGLSNRADVLINGKRYRISGTITMDHFLVDVGDDEVGVGDEVVILGRQGDEVIDAVEHAAILDTIPYEIVCGIGSQAPRIYLHSAQ
jgi:alanine racemase